MSFKLILTSTIQLYNRALCVHLYVKVESVKYGVGVKDSSYLANLAKSLETYSEQMTDAKRQNLWLGAGNLETVVRGVRSLASARSVFTATPCSYDEVHVRIATFC